MKDEITRELYNEEEDTQKDKYLTFSLGSETYGIEIRYVTEIVGIQPITVVPELPDYIKGIINLRGKIIPVLDVRSRFKKSSVDYNDRTCIVVIDIKDISIGIIVDTVEEVLSIPEDEIVPPPDMNKAGRKYIKGIGKTGSQVTLLLDCEKLLDEDEVETIYKIDTNEEVII
ncbi:MAG: CheW protein [Firmicutes bacterium]|nr:CheW protein [Bacillota bacterium]